jgi:hypothetical protein
MGSRHNEDAPLLSTRERLVLAAVVIALTVGGGAVWTTLDHDDRGDTLGVFGPGRTTAGATIH